ncbi:MAG: AAA family ATPase [Pseudomonadota bacterium]
MNIGHDDFDLSYFKGMFKGAPFEAREIPTGFVEASNSDAVVLSPKGDWLGANAIIVRGFQGLDPTKLFDFFGPADFAAEGFKPLIVLSSGLNARGEIATPISLSAETFHPRGAEWEPVPAKMQSSPNSHQVETLTINSKRFSRLTPEGVAAAKAAKEAADLEERARQKAEAAADEKRKADELAAAEQVRRLDDQQKFWAWSDTLPPHFLPDAYVLDMTEFDPRVAKVIYPGVNSDGECYWHSCPVDQLPKSGAVMFGPRTRFSNDGVGGEWELGDNWEKWGFYTHGRPAQNFKRFIPYVGKPVPIGTRIPRAEALQGRDDPGTPALGDIVIATIDLIGDEYSLRAGENFTIEEALCFLIDRAPDRLVAVPITRDSLDDDDWEDPDDRPLSFPTREMVSRTVAERYPVFFERGEMQGGFLDAPYANEEWHRGDKKLLDREARKRNEGNDSWQARKPIFERLFRAARARLVSANEVSYNDQCNFGRDGIRAVLAMREGDLDRLVNRLRAEDCQVLVYKWEIEPEDGFVERHLAPAKVLEHVLDCLGESKGSVPIFAAMTDGLVPPETAFEFIVDGLFPARTAGLVVSPAKIGKSALVFNLAACVAAGEPFLGQAVQKGKAALIYGEDTKDVIDKRRMDAAELTDKAGSNLWAICASGPEFSLEGILSDLKKQKDLRLVVIDTASVFVSNTNDGGAAREFMQKLQSFAEEAGCCVVVVHHTGKDLPADKARSAKAVYDKVKGSGEFGSVARFIVTLHLEAKIRDGETALRDGARSVTLYRDNIPSSVPKMVGSLVFQMDRQTGIIREVAPPNVSLPATEVTRNGVRVSKTATQVVTVSAEDGDAHAAALVIQKLEDQLGHRLPFAGSKSLYYLKGRGELVGWSRARCERAHRRAVELSLYSKASKSTE